MLQRWRPGVDAENATMENAGLESGKCEKRKSMERRKFLKVS